VIASHITWPTFSADQRGAVGERALFVTGGSCFETGKDRSLCEEQRQDSIHHFNASTRERTRIQDDGFYLTGIGHEEGPCGGCRSWIVREGRKAQIGYLLYHAHLFDAVGQVSRRCYLWLRSVFKDFVWQEA
jgi:hypothetical protein